MRKLHTWALPCALIAALGTAVVAHEADAARRRKAKRPKVGVVQELLTPLGLQGKLGAGQGVIVWFRLVDFYQRKHEIDVEYGFDRDGNGVIDPESEYRPASSPWADPRETGAVVENSRGKQRVFYDSAREYGKPHLFVWDSVMDLETNGIIRTAESPGVRIRVRPRRKTGKKRTGEWVYTDGFSLENRSEPHVTLDGVVDGLPPLVRWTAINAESEDANGNGVVDFIDGEDRNGNGEADLAPVDAEFEYHVLEAGEDPSVLPDYALARLDWQPCTQDPVTGDAVVQVPTSPVGLTYTFAWTARADLSDATAPVILRARVRVDDTLVSEWDYLVTPFSLPE